MAYNEKGFRTHDFMFNPSGLAGANLSKHSYVTNDDRAALETTGYFNALAKRVKKGDHLDVTLTLSGTPSRRNYIISNVTATVVTIAAQDVATS